MIVGLTGPIASGKSVLAEMLVQKGFIRLNLSDEVRELAKKEGLMIERKILQDLGNRMRESHGSGYWAKVLLSKVNSGKNYVIEGIRNPGEIEELRKNRNFVLVGIDAPVERRWERISKRGKDSDPKTIEGIRQIDARDRGEGEKSHGQQVDKCFALSDSVIFNNTSLLDLKEKAEELVEQLGC